MISLIMITSDFDIGTLKVGTQHNSRGTIAPQSA